MREHVNAFLKDTSGSTAIEYALIASMVALALVGVLTNLGKRLSTEFSEISSVLK
jgi:pilus assembly protein Flp/PilA